MVSASKHVLSWNYLYLEFEIFLFEIIFFVFWDDLDVLNKK
jgi:hypothetical protein